MSIITKWSEVEDLLGGPTEAEKKLRAACAAGEVCEIALDPPEKPSQANRIRADILRYFILGGCWDAPVRGAGVEIMGAWIDGPLDLEHQMVRGCISLFSCHIADPISARSAHLGAIYLNRSRNIRFDAETARIDGNALLDHVRCSGSISFVGAQIGGQLSAIDAHFGFTGGSALIAQGAIINGGVFLERACCLGAVSFSSATISGQFVANKAHFGSTDDTALNLNGARVNGGVFLQKSRCLGAVSLSGAKIGGTFDTNGTHFEYANGVALNVENARVVGGVFLRDGTKFTSASFASARIEVLADDLFVWSIAQDFVLNGLIYERFAVVQPNLGARLEWLRRGSHRKNGFSPQPYTQYAKVMRASGHEAEARKALLTETSCCGAMPGRAAALHRRCLVP